MRDEKEAVGYHVDAGGNWVDSMDGVAELRVNALSIGGRMSAESCEDANFAVTENNEGRKGRQEERTDQGGGG